MRSRSLLVIISVRFGQPSSNSRDITCRVDHLLEVVDQQQQLTFADVLGDTVLGAQRLGDRLGHERRVAKRCQADPEDPGLECRNKLVGDLERKPRLTRRRPAPKRDEARALSQQTEQLAPLPRSADERRGRPRQVRVRDRLQRREPLPPQLEERDRLGEVFQPVLAQVEEVAVDERCRGRREDDLAAVPRGGDASSAVQLTPGVTLASQKHTACVQTYPHLDRSRAERS